MDKNTEVEEILPEGVKLRDFDDYETLRKDIFQSAQDNFIKSFPKSYGGVRMEVDNVRYEDPEHYSLRDQQKAMLQNKFLGRRLRGTLRLINESDGSVLDEKDMTLMRVPYLTNRGTFVHNGSDYAIANQFRLDPGVYARRKANGDIEAHFNIKRGTGNSFRLRFEPETALYKIDIGGSSIKLYSLLNNLGVDDEKLKSMWGERVFEANKNAYDERDFEKAYSKFMRYKANPHATYDQKRQEIREALGRARVNRDILEKTLPNLFIEKSSGVSSLGCLMCNLNIEDAAKFVEWEDKNIKESCLHSYGKEREIHITVMYGFHPDMDINELRKFLNGRKVKIRLGKIDKFRNEEFDVLKISVDSEDLQKLNKDLREMFGDYIEPSEFPDYNPHITLAYVKKGECEDLVGNSYFENQVYVFDDFVFSDSDSKNKIIISTEEDMEKESAVIPPGTSDIKNPVQKDPVFSNKYKGLIIDGPYSREAQAMFTGQWENYKPYVYIDTTGNATVGHGFNLGRKDMPDILERHGLDYSKVRAGTQHIPEDISYKILESLIEEAEKVARNFSGEAFDKLPVPAQQVLIDMSFNMGPSGIGTFKKMQEAVRNLNLANMAKEMKDSLWYRQVKSRGEALVDIINDLVDSQS